LRNESDASRVETNNSFFIDVTKLPQGKYRVVDGVIIPLK
jgi:hypothetical protein